MADKLKFGTPLAKEDSLDETQGNTSIATEGNTTIGATTESEGNLTLGNTTTQGEDPPLSLKFGANLEPNLATQVEELLGKNPADFPDEDGTVAQADEGQIESVEPEAQVWSSHPAQNLQLGKFFFEKAQLRLTDPDAIAEFKSLLAQQPAQIRNMIKTLDVDAANAMIARLRGTGGMFSGIDTTANSFSGRDIPKE